MRWFGLVALVPVQLLIAQARHHPPLVWTATDGLGFVLRAQRDRRGAVTGMTVGSGRVRRMLFTRLPSR
jgi:hypothetical protein